MTEKPALTKEQKDQQKRLKWFTEARFGLFIHWGLYSQLGRGEWAMHRERIPIKEYEPLAESWKVNPRPMREWAKLAKAAGQKYMIMTTKHHEGYCLWDTKMTDYNSVKHAPHRDLVQEFVDACREFDLKVGFYYSLGDWHNPDWYDALKDQKSPAARRFLDFTHGCVRELMSNYGKIDILWYDGAWPFGTPEGWEADKMNGDARKLQPQLLINNRSWAAEDFGTPEESITPDAAGRAWEACMTFNHGSWGWMPAANVDHHTARDVIAMLRTCCGGAGNLLLNIGPRPDGSVFEGEAEELKKVGKWLAKNGEAVYGKLDRSDGLPWMITGNWSRKGNIGYFWCLRWTDGKITIGDIATKIKKITLLETGKEIEFVQEKTRVILKGLPKASPDKIVGITIFKFEFAGTPKTNAWW